MGEKIDQRAACAAEDLAETAAEIEETLNGIEVSQEAIAESTAAIEVTLNGIEGSQEAIAESTAAIEVTLNGIEEDHERIADASECMCAQLTCICEQTTRVADNTDGLVPAILQLIPKPTVVTSPDGTIDVTTVVDPTSGGITYELEVNPCILVSDGEKQTGDLQVVLRRNNDGTCSMVAIPFDFPPTATIVVNDDQPYDNVTVTVGGESDASCEDPGIVSAVWRIENSSGVTVASGTDLPGQVRNLELDATGNPFTAFYQVTDNCGTSEEVSDTFSVSELAQCEVDLSGADGKANRRYYAGAVALRGSLNAEYPGVYTEAEALTLIRSKWGYANVNTMSDVYPSHPNVSNHYMLGATGLEYMFNTLDSNGQPVLRSQVINADSPFGIVSTSNTLLTDFVVDDTDDSSAPDGHYEFYVTSSRIILPCSAGRSKSVRLRLNSDSNINEGMLWAWKGARGATLSTADATSYHVRTQATSDPANAVVNTSATMSLGVGEFIDLSYISFDSFGSVSGASVEMSVNGGAWFSITEEQDLIARGMAITSLY